MLDGEMTDMMEMRMVASEDQVTNEREEQGFQFISTLMMTREVRRGCMQARPASNFPGQSVASHVPTDKGQNESHDIEDMVCAMLST